MKHTIAIAAVIFLCAVFSIPATSMGDDEATKGNKAPARVSLHVAHLELQKIIKLAAKETEPEYVLSQEVWGTCSLDMYDVTFEELLDVVLPLHAARWYKKDGVIHILTEEQFLELRPEVDPPAEETPDAKADQPDDQEKRKPQHNKKEPTTGIQVQDLDIQKVMQLLSIQSKRNILVTGGVQGQVTATLKDMTTDQVIDHIILINGWARIELNGCTCILTQEEYTWWQDRQKAEQQPPRDS